MPAKGCEEAVRTQSATTLLAVQCKQVINISAPIKSQQFASQHTQPYNVIINSQFRVNQITTSLLRSLEVNFKLTELHGVVCNSHVSAGLQLCMPSVGILQSERHVCPSVSSMRSRMLMAHHRRINFAAHQGHDQVSSNY